MEFGVTDFIFSFQAMAYGPCTVGLFEPSSDGPAGACHGVCHMAQTVGLIYHQRRGRQHVAKQHIWHHHLCDNFGRGCYMKFEVT